MHVERSERTVGELINQISRSEVRLPELQRDYVWKPTQVAKLVDSLYRGYPSGSLLFWETGEMPVVREMAIGEMPPPSGRPPLYLLDGQQRLTSLFRVFIGHYEAQIVFNAEKDRFQNQSAATRTDPKWISVAEVLDQSTGLLGLTRRLIEAGCALPDVEIERRLMQIRQMREHRFHLEILKGFSYGDIADIFVRVNSAGRHLSTLDLAMATLSARWPGVLEKLQKEAAHWRRQGYGDLDVNFLSRALAGTVLHGGLSTRSHGQLEQASDVQLEQGWAKVQRGLAHLVPLLKGNLKLSRSAALPSTMPLIPLVVLLGNRSDARLDRQTGNAIIYWLLVATIRSRYGGSTDTKLTQDIHAAERPKPIEALLRNLDVFQSRPQVTPESLAGRTKESPYFFLSLLVTQLNEARDWWFGTQILHDLEGQQKLEHHHIHPVATLEAQYDKAEINDLANLVFISARANRKISSKSPKIYFPELGDEELAAHYVPTDESLRDVDSYLKFLARRRGLLAEAMTQLLDKFRPDWLNKLPTTPAATTDGMSLSLVLYASAWDSGTIVFSARRDGIRWSGSASMADLEQALNDAGVVGIDSDVDIAGESVPVQVLDDSVEMAIGPFLVHGSAEQWLQVFERERSSSRSLALFQKAVEVPWTGERIRFPVTDTE
jgi:hypothetical protein